MTSTRPRNTVIALGLAALAAIFTAVYFGSGKSNASTNVVIGQVLVAGRDIPVGTPGAKLLQSHLVLVKKLDASAIAPDAVRSAQQLVGVVTAQPVYAGEQLTVKRFAVSAGNPSLAGLRGRARAITLSADPAQLLAGTLRDGDHVDVVASGTYPAGSQQKVSRIVLRGLLVLHAPTDSGSSMPSASSTTNATLALTDAQAQKLFYVVKNADWSLILRPAVRASDSSTAGDTAATVLGGGR
jgi:pilus assembly protein CpaB